MSRAANLAAVAASDDAELLAELLPVSSQIAHFLAGSTNGSALFHALYDHAAPDVYTVQLVLELEGALEPARLRAAAQTLLTVTGVPPLVGKTRTALPNQAASSPPSGETS